MSAADYLPFLEATSAMGAHERVGILSFGKGHDLHRRALSKQLITRPEGRLEPGLVAVGESGAVKHAIDAQMSAHSITSNNQMMERVSDIELTNNAWAASLLSLPY